MFPFLSRTTVLAFSLLAAVPSLLTAASRQGYRAPASANMDSLLRILSAENKRSRQDTYLSGALQHPTASVRRAAILAIGRIGETAFLGELVQELNKKNAPNKDAVVFALGLIPDEMATTIAVQHLAMQPDPKILASLYSALGMGGGEKHLPVFVKGLSSHANPIILEGVCRGLGLLWAKESDVWEVPSGMLSALIQRAGQSDRLATACGFALSRFKGLASHIPPGEIVALAGAVKPRDAQVFLLKTLGRVHTPASTTLLIQKSAPFAYPATRVEAIKALSQHPPTAPLLGVFRKALEAPQSAVVAVALDGLQEAGTQAKDHSPQVLELFKKSKSSWLRSKALRTGIALDPLVWKPLVLAEINKADSPLRSAAAGALALGGNPADAALLAALLKDTDPKVALETLETLAGWPEQSLGEVLRAALLEALNPPDPATLATVSSIAEKFKWKEFGPVLAKIYPQLGKSEYVDAKISILSALASLEAPESIPLIQAALADSERLVASAAADALSKLGKEPTLTPAANSAPDPFTFTASEYTQAKNARVILKTTRGEVHLRMSPEAPANSVNFLRLVKKGFYNGLTFHRVVPGFVVQGGDPRGDGFGGPGYLVRDELSPLSHSRGTVGLATSGKDTGGSQFFINLGPNYHLDGRYTVFAEVTKGLEVAERLEVGDAILTARQVQ